MECTTLQSPTLQSCPKIKCFWGFRCAFCINETITKYPMCEKHIHKWDTLRYETKKQIMDNVNAFNNNYKNMNRRRLQIFIYRIEVLDELNRFKKLFGQE